MDNFDLEFWSASSQLSAVLAFALLVEFRIFTADRTTNRTLQVVRTGVVLVQSFAIGFAFYWSINALYYESSAMWQKDWTKSALSVAFLLIMVSGISYVLVRVWSPRPEPRRRPR